MHHLFIAVFIISLSGSLTELWIRVLQTVTFSAAQVDKIRVRGFLRGILHHQPGHHRGVPALSPGLGVSGRHRYPLLPGHLVMMNPEDILPWGQEECRLLEDCREFTWYRGQCYLLNSCGDHITCSCCVR